MKRSVLILLIIIFTLGTMCACTGKESAIECDEHLSTVPDHVRTPQGEEMTVSIHHTKQMTVDGQDYLQTCSQKQTYADGKIQILQTLCLNGARQTVDLLHSDNFGYLFMDGTVFRQELTQEDFTQSYVTLPTVDPALYGNVESHIGSGESILFHLSAPTAPEAWALPQDAVFTSAEAYLQVDEDQIQMVVYHIRYQIDRISFSEQYLLVYHPEPAEITLKPDKNAVLLRDMNAPLMLEQASSILLKNEQVSSVITKEMTSQITGIVLKTETNLSRKGSDSQLVADVEITRSTTDPSRGGTTELTTQQEHYEKLRYSIRTNGGSATEETDVTPETMADYCNNMLLECILLPRYIQDATMVEEGKYITVRFAVSNDLESAVIMAACDAMYQDDALSRQLQESSVANSFTAWLKINKITGFPVEAGIDYDGLHVLPESNYAFSTHNRVEYQYP